MCRRNQGTRNAERGTDHAPDHPRRPQPRFRRRVHVLRPRRGEDRHRRTCATSTSSPDIESLNRRALDGELEVTAVSIHAYAYLADKYALLQLRFVAWATATAPGWSARTAGPPDRRAATKGKRIAVPGKLTTAFLSLKLFQPDFEAVVVPFDQIEDAVIAGKVDLGLLIHEGQLTYQDQGLHLWADMGEWWFSETGLPLPLGGNVVRRDLGPVVVQQVARDLKASIVYALEHRAPALAHARQFNRGIGDEKTDTIRRDVRERLDRRLRRPGPRGGTRTPEARPPGRSDTAPGGGGVCRVVPGSEFVHRRALVSASRKNRSHDFITETRGARSLPGKNEQEFFVVSVVAS